MTEIDAFQSILNRCIDASTLALLSSVRCPGKDFRYLLNHPALGAFGVLVGLNVPESAKQAQRCFPPKVGGHLRISLNLKRSIFMSGTRSRFFALPSYQVSLFPDVVLTDGEIVGRYLACLLRLLML